jgi:hypothetical protein
LYYIEQLIEKGAKINATNKYGYNALHMSLFSFNEKADSTPRVERMLIESGININ